MRSRHARVVLLDPDHWDAFELLASALRAHRMQVVHLVPRLHEQSLPARIRERIMFGSASGGLARVESPGALDPWVAAPTVDIQGPDDLVAAFRAAGAWPRSALASRVPDPSHVGLLYDKLAMQDFAAALGIVVPRVWPEPPEDTLPIVVKRAAGSGGAQVRVVHARSELAAAVREVDPDGRGGVFFQEYLDGPPETFGGVADQGRLIVGATYRLLSSPTDPLGPAEGIEVVDSKEIHDQVEILTRALDYTGFLCVDFMRLADGRAALIDVNPRVFGSWLAVQQAGFDVLGAYLALLGLPQPRRPHARQRFRRSRAERLTGEVQRVRHTPRTDVEGWGEWASEARSSARSVRDATRVVGWRYGVVGMARGAGLMGISAVRLLRR